MLVHPGYDCHAVWRVLERMLADRFGIGHTTLQVVHAGTRAPVPVEIAGHLRPGAPSR